LNLIKGAIHIHSNYSYDGEKSLEDIKHLIKRKGISFICCTEHAETLDDSIFDSFVLECLSLSDENFIIIPGIEYKYENIEILALNMSKLIRFSSLDNMLAQIKEHGGLSILAHPHKYKDDYDLTPIKKINGIEIWNCRYEGGKAPRFTNIKLLRKLNKGHIYAYAGLDFHNERQNISLYHYLEVEKFDREGIINALAEGKYSIGNDKLKLNSVADIGTYKSIAFSLTNFKYDLTKWVVDTVRRFFHLLHIKPGKCLHRIMVFLDIRP
jgi:hypothetical protein